MTEQIQTARAVIFNEDGKLLMIERHKKDDHYFSLPGGRVEAGENAEDAVIREVHEETGLAVTIARLLYIGEDSFFQKQHIFLCNYHGGEPQLQNESIEAKLMESGDDSWHPGWFTPEFLQDMQVYPIGLLSLLDEDIAQDFANNPREIVEPA